MPIPVPPAAARGHQSAPISSPAVGADAARFEPRFSLLRLSAPARLGLAGALAALIWAGVFWAIA